MRPQKRLPRCWPLRHGREPVRLQDPRNRGSADTMSKVLQRATDPRVAPGWILFRHPHDEPPDLREHALLTVPTLRMGPFARDEMTMPSENRVGSDDGGDLEQSLTPQSMPAHREPTPFVIVEPQAPPSQLTPKDSILFDQIGQGLLLLTIQAGGQRAKKNPLRANVDHGASLHHRPIFAPRRRSAELWDIAASVARATTDVRVVEVAGELRV